VSGMIHTEARGGTPYGATTIAGGRLFFHTSLLDKRRRPCM
jgi:hypothetical protein